MSALKFGQRPDKVEGLDEDSKSDAQTESREDTTAEVVDEPVAVDDRVIFSSHPAHRFKLGKYQFENAVLKLSPEEAEKFRARLKDQPVQVRNQVKEIDVDAANKMILARITSKLTSGIGTTQGSIGPKAEGT